MSINTERDLKRAWDYGGPIAKFPFPIAIFDRVDLAHIWGSFIEPLNPVPDSPLYIGDYTERTLGLFVEQFKRRYP